MSEFRWQPIRCAISLSFKLSTVRKASCYVCIFGIKKNFVHDLKAFVYYFPDQFILILEYFFLPVNISIVNVSNLASYKKHLFLLLVFQKIQKKIQSTGGLGARGAGKPSYVLSLIQMFGKN